MLEELIALGQIADIDSRATAAETELREIPERIAAMDADLEKLLELLEAERQQLAEAEKLLATADEDIAAQNQHLAKSKNKGAMARNMRETDAAEREVQVVRRNLKDREAERDTLKKAIEERRGAIEKRESDLAQIKTAITEQRAAAEARLAEVKAAYETVLAGRDEAVAKVPGTIMRRYNLIRSRRGSGVSLVKGESCVGCNVSLAPQQVIKVQRGESVEQCPNCQRFLLRHPGGPGAQADDSNEATEE